MVSGRLFESQVAANLQGVFGSAEISIHRGKMCPPAPLSVAIPPSLDTLSNDKLRKRMKHGPDEFEPDLCLKALLSDDIKDAQFVRADFWHGDEFYHHNKVRYAK